MSRFDFFRKWVRFLRKARVWVDILAVLFASFVFIYFAPPETLNSNPATGGDTGSHFWPLVTLVKEGLPNFQVRVWNPGNLGGEPHLTHYFPLPYLFMAFLSLFMPLGRAFNIGTFFPLMIMPLSIYLCFRGLKSRFPIPAFATIAGLSFLYNESFSMWGGNALSTLAGQFAHLYAFCFFLLGIGVLNWDLSRRRFPWCATFLFTGVLLSHFYMALYLPIVFICFLFFHAEENFQRRLKKLVYSGLLSLALSAWFVLPMLHNAKWTTPFGLKWASAKLIQEAFPSIFWPFGGLLVVYSLIFIAFNWLEKPQPERENKLLLPLLSLLILISVAYFFIFPGLGLVDVRIFPVLQMCLCFFGALALGLLMHRSLPQVWVLYLSLPLVLIGLWWSVKHVNHFPHWLKWNYSSWPAKKAYPELMKLSKTLQGTFSDPRVIYENSELSDVAGTMRVFEMLPYFANRATLESVYMQATVLAPAAFYLQALVSRTPSCPFPNYACAGMDLQRAEKYLDLMGISQVILISPEAQAQAAGVSYLGKQGDYGLWHLYRKKSETSLVEVLRNPPEIISENEFKQKFYQWLLQWKGEDPFLVVDPDGSLSRKASAFEGSDTCQPRLAVAFNQMTLQTDCPGRFHYLKFAFHSTWETSTGDGIYLMSPGFIGLIPSSNEVILRWGRHWFWNLANAISWLTLIGILLFQLKRKLRGKFQWPVY